LRFSHYAAGACGGPLALFKLFSSSSSPSFLSSLLPLILSPSPSSESMKSCEISEASPSGFFFLGCHSLLGGSLGPQIGSQWGLWVRCLPSLAMLVVPRLDWASVPDYWQHCCGVHGWRAFESVFDGSLFYRFCLPDFSLLFEDAAFVSLLSG
jgi:hypothetical protein